MTEKREVCTCENCGNEAEMIISCHYVDVEEVPGTVKQQMKETRKCTLCGNEADMIIEEER